MIAIGKLTALGVLGAALTLTACGGGGGDRNVATAGGSATPTASATADTAAQTRQYVDCLRAHGVDVADPQPGQPLTLDKVNDPATRSALQTCRNLAPQNSDNRTKVDSEQERQYAACMRRNGIPSFPDPDPDAGLLIPKSLANDPHFAQAESACASLLGKSNTKK